MTHEENCSTCRFWNGGTKKKALVIATCRRRYPHIIQDQLTKVVEEDVLPLVGRWPLTKADDWCGEWQPLPGQPT